MTQPTWAVVEQGIRDAIATAAGVSCIWSFQGANAPANPYVRLSLGSLLTTGIDYVDESAVSSWAALTVYAAGAYVLNDGGKAYVCTTGGTSAAAGGPTGTGATIVDGSVTWGFYSAGAQFALTVGGMREVALQMEAFTGPPPATSDPAFGLVEAKGETARALMDRVVTRLRLPTARNALLAVGVVPFDPGPVNWIPDVVSVGFRGRASCDVRCRMPARALSEFAAGIASVSGTITVQGGPAGEITRALGT